MAPRDSVSAFDVAPHSGEFSPALERSLELEDSLEISLLQAALPSTAVRKHLSQSNLRNEECIWAYAQELENPSWREEGGACWQSEGTVGGGGTELKHHIFSHKHPTERSGSRHKANPCLQ